MFDPSMNDRDRLIPVLCQQFSVEYSIRDTERQELFLDVFHVPEIFSAARYERDSSFLNKGEGAEPVVLRFENPPRLRLDSRDICNVELVTEHRICIR